MFIVFQIIGAAVAVGTILVLYPSIRSVADDVVVPHSDANERDEVHA